MTTTTYTDHLGRTAVLDITEMRDARVGFWVVTTSNFAWEMNAENTIEHRLARECPADLLADLVHWAPYVWPSMDVDSIESVGWYDARGDERLDVDAFAFDVPAPAGDRHETIVAYWVAET
jgi:hypothetical protein